MSKQTPDLSSFRAAKRANHAPGHSVSRAMPATCPDDGQQVCRVVSQLPQHDSPDQPILTRFLRQTPVSP